MPAFKKELLIWVRRAEEDIVPEGLYTVEEARDTFRQAQAQLSPEDSYKVAYAVVLTKEGGSDTVWASRMDLESEGIWDPVEYTRSEAEWLLSREGKEDYKRAFGKNPPLTEARNILHLLKQLAVPGRKKRAEVKLSGIYIMGRRCGKPAGKRALMREQKEVAASGRVWDERRWKTEVERSLLEFDSAGKAKRLAAPRQRDWDKLEGRFAQFRYDAPDKANALWNEFTRGWSDGFAEGAGLE